MLAKNKALSDKLGQRFDLRRIYNLSLNRFQMSLVSYSQNVVKQGSLLGHYEQKRKICF